MEIKLRDYFAGKAMQVLLEKFNPERNYTIESIAKDAYAVADAMILQASK